MAAASCLIDTVTENFRLAGRPRRSGSCSPGPERRWFPVEIRLFGHLLAVRDSSSCRDALDIVPLSTPEKIDSPIYRRKIQKCLSTFLTVATMAAAHFFVLASSYCADLVYRPVEKEDKMTYGVTGDYWTPSGSAYAVWDWDGNATLTVRNATPDNITGLYSRSTRYYVSGCGSAPVTTSTSFSLAPNATRSVTPWNVTTYANVSGGSGTGQTRAVIEIWKGTPDGETSERIVNVVWDVTGTITRNGSTPGANYNYRPTPSGWAYGGPATASYYLRTPKSWDIPIEYYRDDQTYLDLMGSNLTGMVGLYVALDGGAKYTRVGGYRVENGVMPPLDIPAEWAGKDYKWILELIEIEGKDLPVQEIIHEGQFPLLGGGDEVGQVGEPIEISQQTNYGQIVTNNPNGSGGTITADITTGELSVGNRTVPFTSYQTGNQTTVLYGGTGGNTTVTSDDIGQQTLVLTGELRAIGDKIDSLGDKMPGGQGGNGTDEGMSAGDAVGVGTNDLPDASSLDYAPEDAADVNFESKQGGGGSFWSVDTQYGLIDFDPMNNAAVVSLANWVRTFLIWAANFLLVQQLVRTYRNAHRDIMQSKQIGVRNISPRDELVPLVVPATALIITTLIVTALAVAGQVATTYLSQVGAITLGTGGASSFNALFGGGHGASLQAAIDLTLAFIPVAHFVVTATNWMMAELFMRKVVMTIQGFILLVWK